MKGVSERGQQAFAVWGWHHDHRY